MHFFYLDEAGSTGLNLDNPEQPIFVLGGISVRDEGWNRTSEALYQVFSEYFNNQIPNNFELHAEELLSPFGDGPFKNHDRESRNLLAKNVLLLLEARRHNVHIFGIEKGKVLNNSFDIELNYDYRVPYLLAYDYLLTFINHHINTALGQSARGMLIIDTQETWLGDIEEITRSRRFEESPTHRIKKIVEFTYPVDSRKNPMIQISDLVVFCSKKFLEIEAGYKENYSDSAKQFYAECYQLLDNRIHRKTIVNRIGRDKHTYNDYLNSIQAKPTRQWKRKYGLQ
jgi:hypothetical protein